MSDDDQLDSDSSGNGEDGDNEPEETKEINEDSLGFVAKPSKKKKLLESSDEEFDDDDGNLAVSNLA